MKTIEVWHYRMSFEKDEYVQSKLKAFEHNVAGQLDAIAYIRDQKAINNYPYQGFYLKTGEKEDTEQ